MAGFFWSLVEIRASSAARCALSPPRSLGEEGVSMTTFRLLLAKMKLAVEAREGEEGQGEEGEGEGEGEAERGERHGLTRDMAAVFMRMASWSLMEGAGPVEGGGYFTVGGGACTARESGL